MGTIPDRAPERIWICVREDSGDGWQPAWPMITGFHMQVPGSTEYVRADLAPPPPAPSGEAEEVVKELEESVESERACPHRAEGYRQGVEDAAKVAENGPDLSDNPSPWAIAFITDDPVASLQAAVCLTKQRIANSIRALINKPDASEKGTET